MNAWTGIERWLRAGKGLAWIVLGLCLAGCGEGELQRMAQRYVPEGSDIVLVADFGEQAAESDLRTEVLTAGGLQLYRIFPAFGAELRAGVTAIVFPERAEDLRTFCQAATLWQFLYRPNVDVEEFASTFEQGLRLQAERSRTLPFVERTGDWLLIEEYDQAFRVFPEGVYRVSDAGTLAEAQTHVEDLLAKRAKGLSAQDPLLTCFGEATEAPGLTLGVRDLADLIERCTTAEDRQRLSESFPALLRTHAITLSLPLRPGEAVDATLSIETEDEVAALEIREQLLAFRTYQLYVAQGRLGRVLRDARFTVHGTTARVSLTGKTEVLRTTTWDLIHMLLRHFPIALE